MVCSLGTPRVERGLRKWGTSLYGRSVKGAWRGALLLGSLKVMYKKALVMGILP
jgi:hypothetical protein